MPVRLAFVLTALAGVVAAGAQVAPAPRPVVINRVSVIDPATGTVRPDLTVVVRDRLIVAVGTSPTIPRDADILDDRNRFLIPGLWDMHVHLSYARASALPVFVAHGVTGIRDVGSDLADVDTFQVQADLSPLVMRSGPMLNGMEFNRYQLAVNDAVEARTAVRTLHKAGVDFVKFHRRTSREAFFAIAEQARALRLPIIGHIPMTVTPAEAFDAGQATIEHAETLFEGTFTAARAGTDLSTEIAQWRATEATALFDKFVANGTFVDPTLIAHEELETLVAAGVSTAAALRAATTNPAQLFPTLQTGEISPGKRADLVLLDGNPLEDIRHTRRIRAVITGAVC